MTLGELIEKLYFKNIAIFWDSDEFLQEPICVINSVTENSWVLSETLKESKVFGIEDHPTFGAGVVVILLES